MLAIIQCSFPILWYHSYYALHFTAEIGGYLGLFLGASVLSLFEVVELGFDCLMTLRNRSEKKESTAANVEMGHTNPPVHSLSVVKIEN